MANSLVNAGPGVKITSGAPPAANAVRIASVSSGLAVISKLRPEFLFAEVRTSVKQAAVSPSSSQTVTLPVAEDAPGANMICNASMPAMASPVPTRKAFFLSCILFQSLEGFGCARGI